MVKKSWFERALEKRDEKAVNLVNRNLSEGEDLILARMGTFDDIAPFNKKPSFTSGVMGVTPLRVIRVSDPFANVRSIPLEQISAINQSVAGGGLFVKVEIVAPDQTLDIQCNSANAQALVSAIESARDSHTKKPGSKGEKDPLVQLEKLAELHSKGILSDDEFRDKKTDLLGQL